jgi:hypothetical protein
MTAFTEIPPGFAFFAAILVYDLILLLRGEVTFGSVDPFYETRILELSGDYQVMLSQSEAGPVEDGCEMDAFTSGGETGWDLLFNFDFPDFS